jgi:SSS family solute:Na+ symporter
MDIYKEYLHKGASQKMLVWVGRISVVCIMLFGCWLAPQLDDPKFGGVFTFIQEFQGFVSPGVLAVFLFGFLVNRAPRMCGLTGLLLNPIIYGTLMIFASHISFLDRMTITFLSIIAVMTLMTLAFPLKEPFKQESKTDMDLSTSKGALFVGVVIVIFTAILYAYFWDHTTAMFPG